MPPVFGNEKGVGELSGRVENPAVLGFALGLLLLQLGKHGGGSGVVGE
jgi:hypothetical protein